MNIEPIAIVRSPAKEAVDENWGDVVSDIVVYEPLAAGLIGLDQFSHALIVFYMHERPEHGFDLARDVTRRPRGRQDMPMLGIFAQRAGHRPNPIGVTAVKIVGVADGVLRVQGLDAIDGTPILDIKPYVPIFDRVDDATVPEWMDRLMEGYF